MINDVSLRQLIRVRYASPRIQWLIGVMTFTSLTYLSSQELWTICNDGKLTGLNFSFFLVLFVPLLFWIHYNDLAKINGVKPRTAFAGALLSIFIDVAAISFAESVILITVGQLPTNLNDVGMMLLIGSIPSALGSIALSTATTDILSERARSLEKEIEDIIKRRREIREQIEKESRKFDDLKKKNTEYEEKYARLKDAEKNE